MSFSPNKKVDINVFSLRRGRKAERKRGCEIILQVCANLLRGKGRGGFLFKAARQAAALWLSLSPFRANIKFDYSSTVIKNDSKL